MSTRTPPRVVVLLGAGASRPLGIPTSGEFFRDGVYEKLDGELRDVLDWLGKSHGVEPQNVDVEHVLSLAETATAGPSASLALGEQRSLPRLAEATKRLIYEKCSAVDSALCANHYLSLVGGLSASATSGVSVFSTNYDRTFEACFTPTGFGDILNFHDYKPRLINGFMPGPHGGSIWSKDAYAAGLDSRPSSEWRIPFYKLHGSVGWVTENRRVYDVGTELQPGLRQPPMMVFPGKKGLPSSPTSRYARYRLLEDLERSDQVVIIGFSFRDDYIADLFDHAAYRRGSRGPVRGLRIDPAESLSADTRLTWYADAFTEIRHVKRPFGRVGRESSNLWYDSRSGQLRYGA